MNMMNREYSIKSIECPSFDAPEENLQRMFKRRRESLQSRSILHKELEEDNQSLVYQSLSDKEFNVVSASELSDLTESRSPSAESIDDLNLEDLGNFEDDANQCEYILSWGCHHISRLQCGCVDEVNMEKLTMILDESINQITYFLMQNDSLYKIELVGSNSFATRLAKCSTLVRNFSTMSNLLQEILHHKIVRLSELFHCELQAIADDVCRNDQRYSETSDNEAKESWTSCQMLKRDIINTENLYDRVGEVKRDLEIRMKEQTERGTSLSDELVVIDLTEGPEDSQSLIVEQEVNETPSWVILLSIGLICAFCVGIILIEVL